MAEYGTFASGLESIAETRAKADAIEKWIGNLSIVTRLELEGLARYVFINPDRGEIVLIVPDTIKAKRRYARALGLLGFTPVGFTARSQFGNQLREYSRQFNGIKLNLRVSFDPDLLPMEQRCRRVQVGEKSVPVFEWVCPE